MIEGQVLVLNKSWVAVHIASVRRALSLLYQDMARAVHPQDYSLYDFDDWCQLSQCVESGQFIHTVSVRIRIPEVIILKGFNDFIRHEVVINTKLDRLRDLIESLRERREGKRQEDN